MPHSQGDDKGWEGSWSASPVFVTQSNVAARVKPQHAESQALSATHGWKVVMEATDPVQGMGREFHKAEL